MKLILYDYTRTFGTQVTSPYNHNTSDRINMLQIRVNSVNPYIVRTPMLLSHTSPEDHEYFLGPVPWKSFVGKHFKLFLEILRIIQ